MEGLIRLVGEPRRLSKTSGEEEKGRRIRAWRKNVDRERRKREKDKIVSSSAGPGKILCVTARRE